jgi:hypothetical protein
MNTNILKEVIVMLKQKNGLLPGEKADLREEIESVVPNPTKWLNTPNSLFGGQKPKDLIGTNSEHRLRDVVRAIKHGVFS